MTPRFVKLINVLNPAAGEVVQVDVVVFTGALAKAFDCMWFDVWDEICPTNLPEMKRLHRRFARRKRTRETYVGSWARWQCERLAKAWGWLE